MADTPSSVEQLDEMRARTLADIDGFAWDRLPDSNWSNAGTTKERYRQRAADTITALSAEIERLRLHSGDALSLANEVRELTEARDELEAEITRKNARMEAMAAALITAAEYKAALAPPVDPETGQQATHWMRSYGDVMVITRAMFDQDYGLYSRVRMERDRLAEAVDAARKALSIMRAFGWHIAAACGHPDDAAMIEAMAAQETYNALSAALAKLDAKGSPDHIAELEDELDRKDAAISDILRALVDAAIPLEVLRLGIERKPYAEITPDLQRAIVKAADAARLAVAAYTTEKAD